LYSTHDLKPNPKDRIYITVWVQDLPIEIKKVFIISNVDEMRCDNGRIEGYMITGKLRADLTSNANSSLKSLPLKAKKIISRGGKYVWPYSKT
jgi:hypothetical protein